ncbi:transcription antitermination factor NusB [Treponema sp.]|uniref:transcription antitermination factor NusB n=1 Tax=Treponema sp. TaxID=166 RepID=UPI003F041DF1
MSRRNGRIFAVQALYSYDVGKASLEDLLKLEWLNEDSENKADGKFVLPEPAVTEPAPADFSHSRAESYDFARLLISGTIEHIDEIDGKIKAHLTANWNFNRLNRVTLSILRISVFALLYQRDLKPTIIIDEAIAISKEFGTDDSFRFINAILDTISKEEVV